MVNYQQGKIYKIEPICEHEENEIYIGSSALKYLSQRMDSHRGEYSKWKRGKRNRTTSFILFDKYGYENCKIILIENYPCNTKEELSAREAYHIKNNKCVNKCMPLRTRKQYKLDNKEKIKISDKLYREANKDKIKKYKTDNKEKIKERRSQIVHCECGVNHTHGHKARHFKSTKHQEYMLNENLKSIKNI